MKSLFKTPTEKDIDFQKIRQLESDILNHKQKSIYHEKMAEFSASALKLAQDAFEAKYAN